MKGRDNTPGVVQDCHDLLAWIIPHLDKFPRLRRYTLRRLRGLSRACRRGDIGLDAIKPFVATWLGHTQYAQSRRLCRQVLGAVTFVRGAVQNESPSCCSRRLEQQTGEPPLDQPQQEQV